MSTNKKIDPSFSIRSAANRLVDLYTIQTIENIYSGPIFQFYQSGKAHATLLYNIIYVYNFMDIARNTKLKEYINNGLDVTSFLKANKIFVVVANLSGECMCIYN